MLSDRLALPVVVENDANAAAWAEFRFGAGRDIDDMILITVGTGVGGGIVHSAAAASAAPTGSPPSSAT